MENLLFSSRSVWTMIHGLVLGGGALMALAAALFALATMHTVTAPDGAEEHQSRYLGWLLVFSAAALWLTVIIGTYVTFPEYRATPPEGLTDLARYPRSLILSNPDTAWLHSFAMETKEHVPWIAAMLATGVAFTSVRHRSLLARDPRLRRMATTVLAICFALAAAVGVLGVLVNKVAPLE